LVQQINRVSKSKKKIFRNVALLIIILCFVSLYPIRTASVPSWKIQIVREDGEPLRGVGVRQYWGDDSIDYQDSVEDRLTDNDGFVMFPPRVVTANFVQRVFYPILNLMGGAHSSWGPHAMVMVLVKDSSSIGSADWSKGKPLPERIVVQPLQRN